MNKLYSLEELQWSALQYETREEWAVNDPDKYDHALIKYYDLFPLLTDHMEDGKGWRYPGDTAKRKFK